MAKKTTYDKAQLALDHLCSKEVITPEEKLCILSLVKSARAPAHEILWFTSYFLKLRELNVEMIDIARMAKEHDRPVNLNWSTKRWIETHDHLSRLSYIRLLSQDSTTFPIEPLRLVPSGRATACVIKSSIRLAVEGGRQGHCIANAHYVKAAMEGTKLFASVIHDKKRWSVELEVDSEENKLYLGSVRGKYNALPTNQTTDTILSLFNAEQKPAIGSDTTSAQEHQETYRTLLPNLLELGVATATFEFSGSGDEGSWDDGNYYDVNQQIVEDVEDEHTESLQEICDHFIDASGYSYYENEEGGHGSITLDFLQGNYHLEMNYCFIESRVEEDGSAAVPMFEDYGQSNSYQNETFDAT